MGDEGKKNKKKKLLCFDNNNLNMPNTPQEWFKTLPPVTKAYLTIAVLTTALVSFNFLSPFALYLDWRLIYHKFEVCMIVFYLLRVFVLLFVRFGVLLQHLFFLANLVSHSYFKCLFCKSMLYNQQINGYI